MYSLKKYFHKDSDFNHSTHKRNFEKVANNIT